MKIASTSNNEENILLGQKLRSRRKDLNLTQSQVSTVVGCSPQQIQKYEMGYSNMTVGVFLKVCQALKIHPNRFFSSMFFSEEPGSDYSLDLEKKLLAAFRSVDNEKVKERIVSLVEALVAISDVESV